MDISRKELARQILYRIIEDLKELKDFDLEEYLEIEEYDSVLRGIGYVLFDKEI